MIDAESLLETVRAGFRISEHGFECTPRKIGDSSLFPLSVVWSILVEMAQYRLTGGRVRQRAAPDERHRTLHIEEGMGAQQPK